MATNFWKTKLFNVASLHPDAKNPRLGRETSSRAPREIVQYLFEHDKALDVAQSIALRGFFPNEPLLVVKEKDRFVVIEGNRRLAALKALREPGLLEGRYSRRVEKLARGMTDLASILKVPATIAPSRRATDRQIVGRHVGSPVLAWEAENRASFILEKIGEGYSNDELRDQLGFLLSDIQAARQTRAIADMARSLSLPDEVKAKLDNPRAKLFTTLERVISSSVGREYLKVKPDSNHGLIGQTTKGEFIRGFTKLVSDVALGKQSSRTLNKNEDIEAYFSKWTREELPASKQGSFVPADIIEGRSVASSGVSNAKPPGKLKPRKERTTVLPKNFKVYFGNSRLVEIRDELVKLDRDDFANAGAVLLRVFLELSILDYMERSGDLATLTEKLKQKGKLRQGIPVMKDLRTEIVRIARARLSEADAIRVEKALRPDVASPFGLDDLNSFVHQARDLPSGRDILQFWTRTEPLFRMMLEQAIEGGVR